MEFGDRGISAEGGQLRVRERRRKIDHWDWSEVRTERAFGRS